jgi:glycosyltransferase involved in cell wall biosynthesis
VTKLLWHSNAPFSPTGYGQQTGLFAPFLTERYDLAVSSFYGLEGAPIRWEGVPVLPGMGGEFGNEYLVQHASRFFGDNPRGGLVFTLMDVWVLDPKVIAQMNCACWTPVDHEPPPPAVVEFFGASGAVPIAMSRFGERMLGRLDPLYVPHAVDADAYKPHEKQAARKGLFPDDAFVVGMVAANKGRPSRKGFAQALQAFKRFSDAHDNAFLYLHTTLDPKVAGGENLPSLLRALEIPQDRIRIADQYTLLFNPYSHADMARIYSAMDVLMNPAMGEGFGIPVLEAQACGTPAIVTDFTAMSEVCGAGWKVEYAKTWTGMNSWQATADVDDIVAALEDCYSMPHNQRVKLSNDARRHAMDYDVRKVCKQFMFPALRVVEQRFANQHPVTVAPRLRAAA